MILIADSGASKTDWRFIDAAGNIQQMQTPGFNPYYQDISEFEDTIRNLLIPQLKTNPQKIYYYGTGCSSEKNKKLIHTVFDTFFSGSYIEIQHDLLAAARALCGASEGIACILGTGSNSCHYDGVVIVENVTSLGYMLGDEGSGAYLGKCILSDYLRGDLPKKLEKEFRLRFPYEKEDFLDKVYNQPALSRFLAGFSRFIFQHIHEPYCYKLVLSGFHLFFEKNVMKYPAHTKLKVHFTGSISFYFSDILRKAAKEKNIVVQHILESPIAGLTLYHQNMVSE